MKILPIFTEQNQGICTVHFPNSDMDELEKLQTWWTDPEYILTFFKKNKQLLANGIYEDYTVNEAAVKTLQDAQTLFDQLYDIAEKGFSDPTDNLSQFF